MKKVAKLALGTTVSLSLLACSQLPASSKKASDTSDDSTATVVETSGATSTTAPVPAGSGDAVGGAQATTAGATAADPNALGAGQLDATQIAALLSALGGMTTTAINAAPAGGQAAATQPASSGAALVSTTAANTQVQQALQQSFARSLANHPGVLTQQQVSALSGPLATFIQAASGKDTKASATAWNSFVNTLGQVKANRQQGMNLATANTSPFSYLGVGGNGLVSNVLSILGPYGVVGAVGGVVSNASYTVAGILSVALQAVQSVLTLNPAGIVMAADNLVGVVFNFLL